MTAPKPEKAMASLTVTENMDKMLNTFQEVDQNASNYISGINDSKDQIIPAQTLSPKAENFAQSDYQKR